MNDIATAPPLAPIPSDMLALGDTPGAILSRLDAQATRHRTPLDDGGTMVWRSWGAGPPLVLLHGGYGSWMHWVRNVLPFAADNRVIAADMPGLGESDAAPEPHTAEGLARQIVAGLRAMLGDTPLDLVGFSFGGVLGGHVAAQLGAQCRRFVIVGSNGLGLPRAALEMRSWRALPTPEERRAVHRHSLEVLMFGDAGRIDDLALTIQQRNAEVGRVRSPLISRGDTLRQVLPQVAAALGGIWGAQDNVAAGEVALRQRTLAEIRPDVDFRVVADAGHWVAYEQATAFNATLRAMLAR